MGTRKTFRIGSGFGRQLHQRGQAGANDQNRQLFLIGKVDCHDLRTEFLRGKVLDLVDQNHDGSFVRSRGFADSNEQLGKIA